MTQPAYFLPPSLFGWLVAAPCFHRLQVEAHDGGRSGIFAKHLLEKCNDCPDCPIFVHLPTGCKSKLLVQIKKRGAMAETADLIIINANVYTVDEANLIAEAVAVRGSRRLPVIRGMRPTPGFRRK